MRGDSPRISDIPQDLKGIIQNSLEAVNESIIHRYVAPTWRFYRSSQSSKPFMQMQTMPN
jgi:hypothetical protein